jgi:hypothetical protein
MNMYTMKVRAPTSIIKSDNDAGRDDRTVLEAMQEERVDLSDLIFFSLYVD